MKILSIIYFIAALLYFTQPMAQENNPEPLIDIDNISTKELDKDVAKALKKTQKLILKSRKENDFETELTATKQWCLLIHNYQFLQQAKDCYFAVGMKEKENAKWPYLYGKAALEQGNINDAIKGFTQTIIRNNMYFPAHYYLIDLSRQAGDLRLAFEYKSKVPLEFQLNSKMLLLNGDLYFETENYYIAIGFYQQALNLVPKAKSINYKIAQAFNILGETQKAQAYLQLSGESGIMLNDPYYSDVKNTIVGEIPYLIEAKSALTHQDYSKAIEAYTKALEFNPASKSANTNLAVAYYQDGQTEEAKKRFLKIIESNPENTKVLYNLANIFLSENNITESIKYFEAFRLINPSDESANLSLIELYFQTRQYQKILDITTDKSMQTHEQGQVYKAKSLIHLKQYKSAIDLLTTIHKYRPQNQETMLLLVKLLTQLPDKSLRNPEKALEYANKAVSNQSNLQSLWQMTMALDENKMCDKMKIEMEKISAIIEKPVTEVHHQFSLQRGTDLNCTKYDASHK